MVRIESIKEFGGYLNRYTHASDACQCEMTFSVYLPPKAQIEKVPALYWLSGLTCTDDNARVKAGAQRYAAELGMALIFSDTSPRGVGVPDDESRYDMGKGAGYYVNATAAPWSVNYHMYDYVTKELPALVEANLPVIPGLRSISGHSMGGHGALICALKNPGVYASVSAFAPLCNPIGMAWGRECMSVYLGDDVRLWETYDATCLVEAGAKCSELFIDVGLADEFYEAGELLPENLIAACKKYGQPIKLRLQEGYDHSYHFVATFIGEHLKHHHHYLTKY